MKTDIHLRFRSVLLRMRNVSDRSWEIQTFPPPGKFCHSWDDNTAHAHCKLDTWGFKHTLTKYVILICSSTVTMVARTRLNVTLYYIVCLVVTRFTGRSNSARNVFRVHINFPSRIGEFNHSTSTGHVTEDGTSNTLHNDDVWADSFSVVTKMKWRDE